MAEGEGNGCLGLHEKQMPGVHRGQTIHSAATSHVVCHAVQLTSLVLTIHVILSLDWKFSTAGTPPNLSVFVSCSNL
jgi:hypothetical protein